MIGRNLKKLMDEAGVNQPLLSKHTGVPQSTIQRILSGAIKSPKNDHLIPICSYFGISLDYLLGLSGVQETPADYNVLPAVQKKADVPVISWVQAGEWNEAIDLFAAGYAEEYIARINGGPNVYALRVRGHSMTAPSGGHPSFPEGYIIHVDPDQPATHNDYVIAKVTGEDGVTFKQYKEDEKPYLFPLNPDYKPIFEEFRVLGRVIGSSMKL